MPPPLSPPPAPLSPGGLHTLPIATSTPTFLDGCVCPGQPREHTLVGSPHGEVGLKPQQSPRSHATKEEELKSLLAAAGTVNLHPHSLFCKLSAYRTSEWQVLLQLIQV